MQEKPTLSRKIRSFVLRQGRLTKGQEKAIQQGSSKYVLPFQPNNLNLDDCFGRSKHAKILEIGFGMGATTAQIAQSMPEQEFLAIEVHTPGVGSLLKLILDHEIPNIRIIQHDAVEVLEKMIAPESLDGVHIFFPDPWHKKRHHKRRLIQAEFLDLLASRMSVGAYLHIATDWQEYAEWILDELRQHSQLTNTVEEYAEKPNYRPTTKFEQRGINLGHGVWDIVFKKQAGLPV